MTWSSLLAVVLSAKIVSSSRVILFLIMDYELALFFLEKTRIKVTDESLVYKGF